MVKLLDFNDKWDDLERNPNPFAIVTMAFLKTVETKGSDQERYQWKKHFLIELYHRGMSRETIVTLYEFIDVVMVLPEATDEELHEEIKQTTEENKMSVLTTAERVGLKKGLKQTISDILEIKFGVAGLALFAHVEQITDIEVLEKTRVSLKQAQSVAEAEALIHAHANF